MKTVAFHTLGCKLNFAETTSVGREFVRRGYRVVDLNEQADVVYLNTCTVTDRADRECRQIVRRALRRSPQAYVVVAGCYAQLQAETIAAIDGVDLVLGTREKSEVFSYAGGFLKEGTPRIHVGTGAEMDEATPAASGWLHERTRAFLKVQDGCDYNCSFCTIPKARGASRGVPLPVLRDQAEQLVREGYREIVLTGVNVGDYRHASAQNFLAALRAVSEVDGVERLRVSSIEPNLLTDELLDFWLAQANICNHFHIPLQSGSDRVLGMMRRRYRTRWYTDRLRTIQRRAPDAGMGADIIVGFPGESDSDFDETYALVSDLPLTYLHVFSYSERPNTDALKIGSPIDPSVRAARSEKLRMLGLRKRRLHHESLIGRDVEVLFESERTSGWQSGLTRGYVRVDVPDTAVSSNDVGTVLVTEANVDGVRGALKGATR